MDSYNQDSGLTEAFGGPAIRKFLEGGHPFTGTIGLIGLDLSEISFDSMADTERESVLWEDWFGRTFEEADVKYIDRFGSHLWLIAEIPEISGHSSQAFADGLARRILGAMRMNPGDFFRIRRGAEIHQDRGYGTAVVPNSADPRPKEWFYEAFLQAAFRLQGRGRVKSETQQGMEMERILRNGEIRSAYQPIIRLRSGQLHGFEALTRCPPGSVFDGPAALFHYAEQEGYSFALDRLARETAIRSCPELNGKQKIFININSGIMKDPHFVSGQTRQWLAARGLKPGQVVLEITERSSIDDFEEAKHLLNHYRSQGYEIAIDDAGAGYSSLQAIVELRPDYIKLDKSLVQKADKDEMKLQMLRTFVRFAKRMKIMTVAEGIETPEELQLVRKMGIDFGQGYLIGRPSETPVYTFPTELMGG